MYKIRDFDWSIKAVADDGTFSGYGSVFGVLDSYNEVVAPGAFAASLSSRSRPVPVLWQHRQDSPIGVYSAIGEDQRGLKVEGKLLINEVAQAREAYALLKAGAVSGLSIGYFVRGSSYDEKTGIRTLTALDLEEVSIVTTPANGEARVETVKSLLAKGGVPSIRDLETVLRDAGFTRSQAVAIAKNGYAGLRDADHETPDLSALIAQIQSFKL
ncbi:HK97 family phage prohead protease [Allorhizobium pseudoryzae]|uniref:HK97 family phage prohead protease n=1 Tax=Allorhizobium pseudoryzae TaxID=379684 RepID=UPI003D06BB79